MASDMKPIKIWGQAGPNPPKIGMLVKELDIPHEIVNIPMSDVKKPEYLAVNPNGRIPAIEDPNTGITLWESGAIIEYIVEKYDTKGKLSFASGSNESYHARQFVYFQTSGQGPYYGQSVWFARYHPEKIPSAVDRYVKEINRVTSVLEGILGKQKEVHGSSGNGPWLVGEKFSIADLCFISWQSMIPFIFDKESYDADKYPLVKEWIDKMMARPAVKEVMEIAMNALQQRS